MGIETLGIDGLGSTRSKETLHNYAWSIIKDTMKDLNVPKGWRVLYSDKSVVLNSPKRTRHIKITTSGSIYIDQLMKDKSVRSVVENYTSISDAARALKDLFPSPILQ